MQAVELIRCGEHLKLLMTVNQPCYFYYRYVLATGSSVFYAQFFGGLADSKDIEIPDVEPAAFLNLLRFVTASSLSP